jgi:signal transduction histidine kinase
MIHEKAKRAGYILAFGIAYLTLGFIGWAANYVRGIPYDGLEWKIITGRVQKVDAAGPAAGLIHPGDQIVAIDNVPPEESLPLYSDYAPGDTIQFSLRRDAGEVTVDLKLSSVPLGVLVRWLIPYIVSIFFWLVATGILAFGRSGIRDLLFFLWGMVVSNLLASGSVSSVGPSSISTMFNVLLWFVGPVTLHFHLHLLELKFTRTRWPLWLSYGIAILGSLPFVIWGATAVRRSPWLNIVYTSERVIAASGLIMSVGLLLLAYRTASKAAIRQKIRIVSLNGSIALVPVIAFNVLPDALFQWQYLPYEVSFLFLIAIPIGYGHAIARHQLIRLDRFMNRASTYTLIVVVMAGLYTLIYGLLQTALRPEVAKGAMVQVTSALALGVSFPFIRSRVQRVVDWAFYGGWYDYRSAVERITRTLQSITDPQDLAISLSHWVRRVLRLESAATLVLGPFGTVLGTDRMETTNPSEQVEFVNADGLLPRQGILHRFLEGTSNPIEARIVRRLVPAPSLTQGERDLQHLVNGVIWVPIHGQDGLLGLVILGPRLANETFHALDMDIMKQVAQHCSAVIENLGLLHQLRARAEEVEGLNRQIVSAREKERRSLSHELHDEVIQDLVALTYRISRDPNVAAEDLRKGIREIIQTVREIIRELRPPMLDNLGLLPALRACVRDFREGSGNGIDVQFRTNCAGEEWFPDDIAITIYRVLYEALSNIRKHAQATTALVSLKRENSQMTLEIQDDGVGFDMPENLGRLVMDRHYGLVTIRERLELVDGSLEIESTIDEGTIIRASMPLPEGLTASGDEREGIRW